jgi:hypothetical protein
MRDFDSLSEQEILALAISLEEEDARVYDDYAAGLRDRYPKSAEMFETMREQEAGHRHRLIESVSPSLRRAHPAHPSPGRQRLRTPQAGLANATAGA